MPEKPRGAPFAQVETNFLARHLAWSASLAIKKQYLVQKDAPPGQPWEMFGPDQLELLSADEPRAYHATASRMFLLSRNPDASLPDITADWMRRVGEDIGCPLRWAAVIRWVRPQFLEPFPKIEVIIRGLDTEDQLVYFPEQYIDHGLRWQLQHALLEALGPKP
jgi:hypothetical protein